VPEDLRSSGEERACREFDWLEASGSHLAAGR